MEETILSAGIDLGTTTTQVVFSRIRLENTASLASVPRIRVIEKRLVYTSAIHFTPLLSPVELDGERIRELVGEEYRLAGVEPQDVATGAVIITGETARKSNAEVVLHSLAGFAGDFVVAAAGPALESIIAGKGAGADRISKEKGAVVANVDIGGGTTNIALFAEGEVVETSCLDIGGRLITFSDNRGEIAWISRGLQAFIAARNLDLQEGQIAEPGQLQAVAEAMADVVDQVLGLAPPGEEQQLLVTDHLLRLARPVEYVSFSGGVADCMAREAVAEPYLWGDLGIFLGQAMARSRAARQLKVLPAAETIRATVVGAGTHTTELSGSTIAFAEELLPLQNIPVVKLSEEDEAQPLSRWPTLIGEKMSWLDTSAEVQSPALAFKGLPTYSFEALEELADALAAAAEQHLPAEAPLIVVVENDFAKALGQALQIRLGKKRGVISIDSVRVQNGDYIDIGRGLSGGRVVPVIVKTLVFGY